MLIYFRHSGIIRHNNDILGEGYSGKDQYKNNPLSSQLKDLGPIPSGYYLINLISFDSPEHGPFCLRLSPDLANNMFSRSGFLIHGDSTEHPGCASEGCIILGRVIREQLVKLADSVLIVV